MPEDISEFVLRQTAEIAALMVASVTWSPMLRSAEAATAAPPAAAATQPGSRASRPNTKMSLARGMVLDILPAPHPAAVPRLGTTRAILKHHFHGLKRARSSR